MSATAAARVLAHPFKVFTNEIELRVPEPRQSAKVLPSVLIADSNPSNLRLVSKVVEEEGFRTVVAHDGREAQRILEASNDFQAAIFEIVLPHVSGNELVRFMQNDNQLSRIPIMMMTQNNCAKLSSESLAAGAAVLLPKPFAISSLQNVLHLLTDNSGRLKHSTLDH
jgi:CheY-like chemotaxis protein